MQQQLFFEFSNVDSLLNNQKYWVQPIAKEDTHWFILNKHYAKRIPPISKSFGLFKERKLVGVVTYGKALTQTVSKGVCGEIFWKDVIELNRLSLLNNNKNEASILIAHSLRLLPKPSIVVSYADTAQNHLGIVYQATNWFYTGFTHVQKDAHIKGMEHLHSRTISNMAKRDDLKETHKENLYYVERPKKHRYVYFVGNLQEITERKDNLRYKILPYPKKMI
jgi:hypothetical protein